VWGNEHSQSQVSSHFGNWSLDELPNFQRKIAGVKTHWIETFLISLEKILECRCLKWDRMTHLDISNTSYGQKKGRESNCQFDSRPLKVGNRPNYLAYMWHATYRWKALDKSYNFALDLTSIRGLDANLWASKVVGVPTLGIVGLQLGSPETKWHLSANLVANHKIYYKGEGGGFPQVRAVMSFVSLSLPMARPSTKSALAMH
jgi:hypothetical protein